MCMCILRITIAIWSQDRGSFFDSRDGCRRQVAWSEIVNHRVWHVSWPYSPSNILTVSQFAIMHFRSLCVSDTHSLESARAKWISIVANERAKAEYRETQKWSRLQWWRRQDGTMSRAIEKSCESGTRQRMCKRMPKNLYLLHIHIYSHSIERRRRFYIFKDIFFRCTSLWSWIYNQESFPHFITIHFDWS